MEKRKLDAMITEVRKKIEEQDVIINGYNKFKKFLLSLTPKKYLEEQMTIKRYVAVYVNSLAARKLPSAANARRFGHDRRLCKRKSSSERRRPDGVSFLARNPFTALKGTCPDREKEEAVAGLRHISNLRVGSSAGDDSSSSSSSETDRCS